MRNICRSIMIFIVFCFLVSSVFADTIYLKNGKIIKGKIVEGDSESIRVETETEWFRIKREDIEKIKFDKKVIEKLTPKEKPEAKKEVQGNTYYTGKKNVEIVGGAENQMTKEVSLKPPSFNAGSNVCVNIANDNLESGWGFNAFFDKYLQSTPIVLRTSFGYLPTKTKVNKLSEGSFSILSIEESVLISSGHFMNYPYFGAGGGYYIVNHDISDRVKDELSYLGFYAKEDVSDAFSLHFRGGFNLNIRSKYKKPFSIFAEVKYVFLNLSSSATMTNLSTMETSTIEDNVNFSPFIISIGLMQQF